MSLPAVKVKPDDQYAAEVVVLVTTLGTKRTEYNAGRRARDLLEIKRAHCKVIDFNRDARAQMLPQIFIDGLYVGDGDDLQGLEDDGLLSPLLRRDKCPCRNGKAGLCNANRYPGQEQCDKCGERFDELLPGAFTIQMKMHFKTPLKDLVIAIKNHSSYE